MNKYKVIEVFLRNIKKNDILKCFCVKLVFPSNREPYILDIAFEKSPIKIILECRFGYYGENCTNQCSLNCNVTRRCDRFTGSCDGGCKPGWTGNICSQRNMLSKKQIN